MKLAVMLLCMKGTVSRSTPSQNSNSKWLSKVGKVSFEMTSMKVLPMQMRLPPRKGEKEYGLRL